MRPSGFYPSNEASNVPLDSRIILQTGSGISQEFSFTVSTDDGSVDGSVVELCNQGNHDDNRCYLIFEPTEHLQAETLYQLSINDYDPDWNSSFTTGTDNTVVTAQTPTIELTGQTFTDSDPMCGTMMHYSYTFSVSNLVLSEDNNTHIYLNQVDADGTLIDIEQIKSISENPALITGKTDTNGACFTISHVAQNGELIGESDVLCTDAIAVDDDTETDTGIDDEEKGCTSMNAQGAIGWLGLMSLVVVGQRRRD
jgi:hypothetical protein